MSRTQASISARRRSRRPKAHSRRSRPPRVLRASITRWSTPSNRPQTMRLPARRRALPPATGSRADPAGSSAGAASCPAGGIERAREHVGLHHHAGSAAGRGIIDAAVLVGGERADVDAPRATRGPTSAPCPRGSRRAARETSRGKSYSTLARHIASLRSSPRSGIPFPVSIKFGFPLARNERSWVRAPHAQLSCASISVGDQ